jgi:hypothetical protein
VKREIVQNHAKLLPITVQLPRMNTANVDVFNYERNSISDVVDSQEETKVPTMSNTNSESGKLQNNES